MGERPAGHQHQVPVPVRIPLSAIRAQPRSLGNIVPATAPESYFKILLASLAVPTWFKITIPIFYSSLLRPVTCREEKEDQATSDISSEHWLIRLKVPRHSMVNQVYLLPKSGVTSNVLPNTPSVMQVRSLAVGQAVLQPNGMLTSAPVMPREFRRVVTPQSGSSTKLVGFFNQLLELSKNVSASTHASVARLIQALVNGELDANSFSTQLRSNLKSANTSMDIAPFIKDNIDLLRRDLASGVCRLPNIQPPPKDFSTTTPVPVTIVTSLPTLGLHARASTAVSTTILSSSIQGGPRIALPTNTTPRIVGTLMSSVSTPAIPTSPATVLTSRSQPPLLAPAPPRVCVTPAINIDAAATLGTVTRYRLAQPISGVTSATVVLPGTAVTTVVPTRFTSAINGTRTSYQNLRPIIATSSTSSAFGINLGSIKSAAGMSAVVSPLIRAKSGYPSSYTSGILPAVHNKVGSSLLSLSGSSLFIDGGDRKLNEVSFLNDDIRHTPASPMRDTPFFPPERVREVLEAHGIKSLTEEAVICLAHGLQIFIKGLLSKLRIIVSHRLDRLGEDSRLAPTDHTREQLRFLQKLDEHDRIRQSELEKDLILKAAKSRSKNEDPHQMQMREMARRIASEDYEREKQHQANLTALHAIGPQRKRRLDTLDETGNPISSDVLGASFPSRNGATKIINTLPTTSRLSIVSANRLGIVTPVSSLPQFNLETTSSNSNTSGTATSGTSDGPNTTGFSLALSLRTHRATMRDIQVVLSRTPRLRRTRTYYKTYWRSQP